MHILQIDIMVQFNQILSISCTTGLPMNLPLIISRYTSGKLQIPFMTASNPFTSKFIIYIRALILSLISKWQQRIPFIQMRFVMMFPIFFTPTFCPQLLQVAVAPHMIILEWSAINFSIELSISSPTFSQYRSISSPLSIFFTSFSKSPALNYSPLQQFLQFIVALQPISLATLHFSSLPAIPQIFTQPIFARYSAIVIPTPPATDEITMFSSSFVFILFADLFHILNGSISFLIEQKEVNPVGPYTVRNLYSFSSKSYGQFAQYNWQFLNDLVVNHHILRPLQSANDPIASLYYRFLSLRSRHLQHFGYSEAWYTRVRLHRIKI